METILAKFFTEVDPGWSLSSYAFMVAFVVFYALYLLIGSRQHVLRALYVIAFSLFFAWKVNGWFMLELPATALVVWLMTGVMKRHEGRGRKVLLWLTLVVEFSPLLYFKYTNFALLTINQLLSANFPLQEILLPIGISFYTFQAISYTVDVYKQRFTQDCSLLDFMFYLTFFPLLMAGPITRAEVLLPQIRRQHGVSSVQTYGGLWLIILGLLKKAVIADYIAIYNNWIFDDPTGYSGFENMMGAIGYTLQIYCDFSGYSDMAIGLAALLGYQLKDNFNFPYKCTNVAEFWHRWHIALSTWMRDYIYIPMGGNRCGTARTYFNNFVTMLVAGLWHGASWMFVIWGALHGGALVVYKMLRKRISRIPNTRLVVAVSWLMMFAFINLTWVFFRSPSLDTAFTIIGRSFTDFDIAYLVPFVIARPTWSLFVAVGFAFQAVSTRWYYRMEARFIKSPWYVKALLLLIVIQLVITFRQTDVQPFIYQQF